jgi:hypothetical protein
VRRLIAQLSAALALACAAQAGASPGGAPATPAPSVSSVRCAKTCRVGAHAVLRGARLADVTVVTFGGEATAAPRSARARRLVVTIPAGAMSGTITVTNGSGQTSGPSPALSILAARTPAQTHGPIATAVSGRRSFVDGMRRPTLSYRLQMSAPAAVTVAVVSQAHKTVVASFDQGTVAPGADEAVAWDGLKTGGRTAAQGRYAFVVSATDGSGISAQTAAPGAFVLLGHEFPIRGRHRFGTGAGRFGAGRPGHTHEGQDVFADCGTPLVAARGGTVKMQKFQVNAGNYLVIDDAGEGTDTMYAHLRDPALVHKGDRVHTGDPIGFVGHTGDADGCHLHFEEWSAPGWYTGGDPFDPLSDLKAWDVVS